MQINKVLFKKSVQSISWLTFACAICGSMMWSVHAILASAFHGGFENAIITASSSIIIFCTLRGKVANYKRLAFVVCLLTIASLLATMLWIDYLRPSTIVMFKNEAAELCTGCIAGSLMSISFMPQMIKIWKTRNVIDISVFMCVFYGLAQMVLIAYWSTRSNDEIGKWLPGVVFCSCVLIMQCCLLCAKLTITRADRRLLTTK